MQMQINGLEFEVSYEAEAGISLKDGSRWWGTRVKYRRANRADKRWTKFLLLDVHPFEREKIVAAINAHAEAPR